MTTAIALTLIALGTVSRLLPHPPNAVAMGALALYAGYRLPRRWAVVIPLAAMLASDLFLDWGSGRPWLDPVRFTSYATFAAIVGLGAWLGHKTNIVGKVGLAFSASLLFFLTTNFAVWAMPVAHTDPVGPFYAPTLAGLANCYAMALPFFPNTAIADLVGTLTLFGLDALAHLTLGRVVPRRLAGVAVPVDAR